jgi:hypothetical protein
MVNRGDEVGGRAAPSLKERVVTLEKKDVPGRPGALFPALEEDVLGLPVAARAAPGAAM